MIPHAIHLKPFRSGGSDGGTKHPSISDEQVLLHELNHRIANEFAAAISIVSLAARRSGSDEVKIALTRVTDLLHHYSDVHRVLQMPELGTFVDVAMYLQQLCLSISRAKLEHRKIKLVLSAQPLRLQADRSWRLGMIVYELITNAARHAFGGGGGEIRVELTCTKAPVKCRVLDSGSIATNVEPGRGLKIVKELARGLGGRFEQRFGSGGSASILAFPYDSPRQKVTSRDDPAGLTQSPQRRWRPLKRVRDYVLRA